jgi:hypothetical protein
MFARLVANAGAREIARTVPIGDVMRNLGWRVRSRNRADCELCKGCSTSTVSFTDRLWKCHRCGEGGDVYSLVRAVHRCDFRTALRWVAELTGLQVADTRSAELEARRQKTERVNRAARSLAEAERDLRLACRDEIYECDSVLRAVGPWDQAQWRRAMAAFVLRNEFLLPEYTLLSFGTAEARANYVLADHRVQAEMIAAIRVAGGVQADNGHFAEVIGLEQP